MLCFRYQGHIGFRVKHSCGYGLNQQSLSIHLQTLISKFRSAGYKPSKFRVGKMELSMVYTMLDCWTILVFNQNKQHMVIWGHGSYRALANHCSPYLYMYISTPVNLFEGCLPQTWFMSYSPHFLFQSQCLMSVEKCLRICIHKRNDGWIDR